MVRVCCWRVGWEGSTNHFPPSAAEMIRHDKVVELLQQRQEKDIRQLNEVGL